MCFLKSPYTPVYGTLFLQCSTDLAFMSKLVCWFTLDCNFWVLKYRTFVDLYSLLACLLEAKAFKGVHQVCIEKSQSFDFQDTVDANQHMNKTTELLPCNNLKLKIQQTT